MRPRRHTATENGALRRPTPSLPAPLASSRRHRLDILNLNNIFMNEWTRHKSPREYCGTGIRLVVHDRSHTLRLESRHRREKERHGYRLLMPRD